MKIFLKMFFLVATFFMSSSYAADAVMEVVIVGRPMNDVRLRALVKDAVSKVDSVESDYSDQWAFTRTVKKKDLTVIETYHPKKSVEKQWTLVSVNQFEPTESMVKENTDIHIERSKFIEEEKAQGKKWLALLIDMNSLKLESESPDEWQVTFSPNYKDWDKVESKKLRGILIISKDGNYVRSVQTVAIAPFAPNYFTKYSEFDSKSIFQKIGDAGYVIHRSSFRAKGKAVLFSLTREGTVEYTDYVFVGK